MPPLTAGRNDMSEPEAAAIDPPAEKSDKRRTFLAKFAAVVIGGVTMLTPLAVGLSVLLDPLRRKKAKGDFVWVAKLDALAVGGTPLRFPVIKDQIDHFNRFPDEPVGMVYLQRLADDSVVALQATCPHLGCTVDFVTKTDRFACPCHKSFFEKDGIRIDPDTCPAPRSLDTLEVDTERLRTDGEVWVHFQKFRTGTPEKIAK